jgi:predicted nucleic acid-binding protein
VTFANIASGASVFLDANIFVYDFAAEPVFGPPCQSLLKRIETGDVLGFISAHIFHEAAHRLMTLEACQTFGWPYAGIARQLRRHPAEIAKLQKSRQALDDIVRIGIRILPVDAQDILLAADLGRQHGLLSGDALLIAMMQSHSLTQLASNDADFDQVPGITRFGPV